MQIQIEQQAHVTVISVVGSIDALTADVLTAALSEQVRSGNTRLVAAFDQVEYTSSAGLRVLLATLKEARQRGGDLRLAGVTPQVNKVLNMSGFNNILKIFADVPAAVASFGA